MSKKKKKQRVFLKISIFISVISFLTIIMEGYRDWKLIETFHSHKWFTVDAYFECAYTSNLPKHDTNSESRMYDWKYRYELDGNKYYCFDPDHPNRDGTEEKTILVAEDDHSLCLPYRSEEEVKMGFSSSVTVFWGIVIVTIVGIPISIALDSFCDKISNTSKTRKNPDEPNNL